MSMGSIVTVHEVVADKVVEKVLGKKAVSKVIKAVNDFAEKYSCSLADLLEKVYEDDPNELSYYCEIEDEDKFQSDYDALAKVIYDVKGAFQKKTGLKGLYLTHNVPDDHYDDIDGFAWALPHSSIYRETPAYTKFKKEYNTETEWSQVVKYG